MNVNYECWEADLGEKPVSALLVPSTPLELSGYVVSEDTERNDEEHKNISSPLTRKHRLIVCMYTCTLKRLYRPLTGGSGPCQDCFGPEGSRARHAGLLAQ